MGRLAPGTTNIHPASGLAKHVYATLGPPMPPPIPMGRMTLAAACASGMRYVPMPTDAEVCGCPRCAR